MALLESPCLARAYPGHAVEVTAAASAPSRCGSAALAGAPGDALGPDVGDRDRAGIAHGLLGRLGQLVDRAVDECGRIEPERVGVAILEPLDQRLRRQHRSLGRRLLDP